ncbi:hypothetical protein K0M31_000701, partial [Melipona bicolor]
MKLLRCNATEKSEQADTRVEEREDVKKIAFRRVSDYQKTLSVRRREKFRRGGNKCAVVKKESGRKRHSKA